MSKEQFDPSRARPNSPDHDLYPDRQAQSGREETKSVPSNLREFLPNKGDGWSIVENSHSNNPEEIENLQFCILVEDGEVSADDFLAKGQEVGSALSYRDINFMIMRGSWDDNQLFPPWLVEGVRNKHYNIFAIDAFVVDPGGDKYILGISSVDNRPSPAMKKLTFPCFPWDVVLVPSTKAL